MTYCEEHEIKYCTAWCPMCVMELNMLIKQRIIGNQIKDIKKDIE